MTTIILIVLLAFCFITTLIQREKLKDLKAENTELKVEKSKISNSIREKGLLVDNLRKHNKQLIRRLDE